MCVAEVVYWDMETICYVVLIAEDLIINYDAILDCPVAFTPCEEFKVLYLMALIVGGAVLPCKHMREVVI